MKELGIFDEQGNLSTIAGDPSVFISREQEMHLRSAV
jgi:ethanolamine ammonia-lyase large subunit